MHVDVESAQDIAYEMKASPNFAKTINLAVWRGADDDEPVASAMDQPDHLGQVWICFSKGEDPRLTRKFRENVMRRIMQRWPDTLSLPIMPTGAIPLHEGLIRTPTGYKVNPLDARKYEPVGAVGSGH